MVAEHGVSERRACKLLEIDRTSYRYEPQPDDDARLREELVALARQKPRFGIGGWGTVGAAWLYGDPQASVPAVPRGTLGGMAAEAEACGAAGSATSQSQQGHQEWSMDFVADGLATGRALRIFTLVDNFTRECLAWRASTNDSGTNA
jgi:putative transposase